jgi:WD40 repeat protein
LWSIGFNPGNSKVVATCTREVNFYSFERGILKCTQGSGWGKAPGAVLCQAFADGTLFTGCHDGSIVRWDGETAGVVTPAHKESPVYVLTARRAGSTPGLISGGKDGTIVVWSIAGSELI